VNIDLEERNPDQLQNESSVDKSTEEFNIQPSEHSDEANKLQSEAQEQLNVLAQKLTEDYSKYFRLNPNSQVCLGVAR